MSANSDPEDIGGICDYCNKPCDTIHSFLRHASHSKSCKNFYDENKKGFLESLKIKAKAISKSKYYRKLTENEKKTNYEREKHWRKANAKKRYVKKKEYQTIEGRIFEGLFKSSFDIAKKEVEERLGQFVSKVDYVGETAMESATDYVFERALFDPESRIYEVFFTSGETFRRSVEQNDNDVGTFDYNKFEDTLEETFEERFRETKIEEEKDWIAEQLCKTLKNFYFRTLNKSYIAYFEDFKPMYKEAMDLEIKTTWKQERDKLYEQKGITKKLLDFIRNQFELKMKRNELVNEYLF